MKKVLFAALGLMMLFAFSACSSDDDDETVKSETTQRYWQEYPESYVRYCDHRFDFRLVKCSRVGSAVEIDFVMTNRFFNKDVKATFWMGETQAHDDMGNAYNCKQSATLSDVISYINGGSYSVYGWGRDVTFVPNQAIRGTFTIKNFDINATKVSIGVHVDCGTQGITLDHNMIEFVNMPLDEPLELVEQ